MTIGSSRPKKDSGSKTSVDAMTLGWLLFGCAALVLAWMLFAQTGSVMPRTSDGIQSRGSDDIDRAKQLCRSTIEARSKHPSTVDIWILSGTSSKTQADGTALVKQTYSEKNDYGLELTYDAYCTLKPNGEFSMWAKERSG